MTGFEIRPDVRSNSYAPGACPNCGRVRLEIYVDGSSLADRRVVGLRCEKCAAGWILDPSQASWHGDFSDSDPLRPQAEYRSPFESAYPESSKEPR